MLESCLVLPIGQTNTPESDPGGAVVDVVPLIAHGHMGHVWRL